MNDLLVIIPATSERGFIRQYLKQLESAGIDYHVERVSEIPNAAAGGTHAYALDLYRRCAQTFGNYEKLVFSDAFDVLFYGTKQEVIDKIPVDYVLCAAERNCYPDPSLVSRITGNTPWRFVNGGLTAGTPRSILDWVEKIEKHPFYYPVGLNQGFLNAVLAERNPLVHIDSTTELFYCLFGETNELEFVNGLPHNKICNTSPNFIHANGKWGMAQP